MYKIFKHWLRDVFKSEEQQVEDRYKALMKEIVEANTFESLVSTKNKIKDFNHSIKHLYYQKWIHDIVNSLEAKWAIQLKLWKTEKRG